MADGAGHGEGAGPEAESVRDGEKGRAERHGPAGHIARLSGKDGPQIVKSGGKRWTDEAEALFLDHLAATCNVTLSAAEAGFSKEAIYKRRRSDPSFAERWQAALDQGYARIEMMLVKAATDTLAGVALDPETPIPPMTVKEAINILQLHRASVRGGDARRAGWQARPRSLDEVRDSILRKLAAIERTNPPRNGEGDQPRAGGGGPFETG